MGASHMKMALQANPLCAPFVKTRCISDDYEVGADCAFVTSMARSHLTTVVECHQPLLREIVEYLANSPAELVRFCGLSAKFITAESEIFCHSLWEQLFSRRWPAFYDCLKFKGTQSWRQIYRDMLDGKIQCTLEIYVRENKVGFAMSAMAALVHYNTKDACYIVKYLSASEVPPEHISVKEERRLRFCPAAVRTALQTGDMVCGRQKLTDDSQANYPYKVLPGFHGLKAGQGVEFQWKMQAGSPFGWWYGVLESLRIAEDGHTATASMTFRHFPEDSRWHQLEVCFGDGNMRPSAIGGFSGGLRGVTEEERMRWLEFFPKNPVVFV